MILFALLALTSAAEVCLFQYNTPTCGWLVQNETYTCGVCRNWSVWNPAPTILWADYGVIVNCYTSIDLYAEPTCNGTTATTSLGGFAFGTCQTMGVVSWQWNNCSNSEIGKYCVETFASTGGICSSSFYNVTRNCTDPCFSNVSASCNNNALTAYTGPGCTGTPTALGAFDTCQAGATNDFIVHFGECPAPTAPYCFFQYTGTGCSTLSTAIPVSNNSCTTLNVGLSLQSFFTTNSFYNFYANASCVALTATYFYNQCYSLVSSSWLLSTANCSAPIPSPPVASPTPTPTPITPPPPSVCLYLYSDLSCNTVSTWFNLTCLGFCTASTVIPVSAAHSCVTNTTILYQNTSCLSSPWASSVNGACQFYSSLFGTRSMKSIDGVCPPQAVITPTPTPTPPGLYCARTWNSLGCSGSLVNTTTGFCQQCALNNFIPDCATGNVTSYSSTGCLNPTAVNPFETCIPTGVGSSIIFYSGGCPALPSPAPLPAPAPNTCGRFWTPSLVCGGPQLQDPVQNYCWNGSSPGLAVNFFASSTYNSFRINCNTQLISFFTGPFCIGGFVTSSFLIGNCFSFASFALPMSFSNTSCNLCSGVYFFYS